MLKSPLAASIGMDLPKGVACNRQAHEPVQRRPLPGMDFCDILVSLVTFPHDFSASRWVRHLSRRVSVVIGAYFVQQKKVRSRLASDPWLVSIKLDGLTDTLLRTSDADRQQYRDEERQTTHWDFLATIRLCDDSRVIREQGSESMMSVDEARTEVDRWLDEVKLRTGKCSRLFRDQLAEGMRHRVISVFAVYDEIGQMEGSDPPRRTGTKPAKPLSRKLRGLMHKHYKASSLASFAVNLKNHWLRKDSQAKREAVINEFCRDGRDGKLAHELVLGAHAKRHAANQMTGEWIVYAQVAGVNYYLTLATHKEPDAAVEARVRTCFAEFPEVAVQLSGCLKSAP
jgi:hypothetical protein